MRPFLIAFFWLAFYGHVQTSATPPGGDTPPAVGSGAGAVTEIVVDEVDVHDAPGDDGFVTATLKRGSRVRVRAADGKEWLVIDPPPTMFCWIEASNLDDGDGTLAGRNGHVDAADGRAAEGRRQRVAVQVDRAVVRSGNPAAALPGPPCGELEQGTLVRLLDRPPLETGRRRSRTVWRAIEPPPNVVGFIRRSGTRDPDLVAPALLPVTKPVYVAARFAAAAIEDPPVDHLPANTANELRTIDQLYRSMRTSQPIARWEFETIRSRYQAALSKAGNAPNVDEAVRCALPGSVAMNRRFRPRAPLMTCSRRVTAGTTRWRSRNGESQRPARRVRGPSAPLAICKTRLKWLTGTRFTC